MLFNNNHYLIMNILLLRPYNPYVEIGASANRFSGLIDGICREGHHVTIGITGGLQKKNEKYYKTINPNIDVVYLSKANHYNGFLGRLNMYFFNKLHLIFAGIKLKVLIKKHYDIVWLTNSASVLTLFNKCFNGHACRSFIELNEFNDIYKEQTHGNILQRMKGGNSSKVFAETIGNIDLIAVMTKTLMDYYRKMAKTEARFIHLPMTVDMTRFANVTTTEEYQKPYIAFTGTMTNQKDGVDVLIKAFAKIAEKYPEYHLYLAGFWHYDFPMQEKLIEKYGLKNRIHYIGTLNREQVPPFLCNASVLVLSRPDSHQAQGGFPTKLGEYLATGNPVCVTKVGEIPDYLEDNVSAFMAEPGDVDSFADAMDRVLCDDVFAKQVGSNGRKVAEEHFNAVIQAKRLVKFLEENLK